MNKQEYRITSKIKSRYYLKLLSPETIKLLGTTAKNININKNGEKGSSFRSHRSSINSLKYSQQWLSRPLKSLVYICSKLII